MKFDFRPSTPSDLGGIRTLLCDVFGMPPDHPSLTDRQMEWKYWQSREDWTGPRSFVLEFEGQIGAHVGLIPGRCRWGDQRITVSHFIDWAARPQAVGAGVSILRYATKQTESNVVMGGSELTRKILPLLGLKSVGQASRWVRVLRPVQRALKEPEWNLRLPAKFGRALLWKMKAPRFDTRGYAARRVMAHEIEAAGIPFPDERRGLLAFERNAGLFRHYLQCPAVETQLWSVEQQGRAVGYFAFANAPGQVRLADCWMESGETAAWQAMVQLAADSALAAHPTAAELALTCADPVLEPLLESAGFHLRGSAQVQFRVKTGIPFPQDTPVRFHQIDGDAAYIHTGVPEFWA